MASPEPVVDALVDSNGAFGRQVFFFSSGHLAPNRRGDRMFDRQPERLGRAP